MSKGNSSKNLKTNASLESFYKVWQKEIPEIQKVAHLFEHKKTKAQVLYLESDDTNKTFGISFKTLPTSSNGVAHILEHCILCGSKKYPVKDPFLQLLKTSLNTFLNAMTYPDKTIYPVASDNNKDFENLVDVYLDSVFYPLLRQEDFETDGWHYDLKSDSEVATFEGVVYNEMKGTMASPEDYMLRQTVTNLYPDNTYHHESGGLPKDIVTLSYDEFKNFHKKFYHPSNSQTFLYGNLDINYYLNKLNVYFDTFEFAEGFGVVEPQKKFLNPVEKELPISLNSTSTRNGSFTIATVLEENLSETDLIGLEVVSYCLFDSEAAPMKKFLEDGMAESLVNGGVADFVLQPFLYYGARGIDEKNIDTLISDYNTLLSSALTNLQKEQIEAGLNSLEFGLRAPGTNDLGIMYMEKVFEPWNYGKDPLTHLFFEKSLEELKTKNVGFFTDLFKKYFIDNSYKLTLKYVPDTEFLTKQTSFEKQHLQEFSDKLTKTEKESLREKSKKLIEYKEKPNDPKLMKKLPKISVKDISKDNREYKTHLYDYSGVPVFQVTTDTPGVIYLTFAFDVTKVLKKFSSEKLYELLSVYFHVALRLGTKNYDYRQWALLLERDLGRLNLAFDVLPVFEGLDNYPLEKPIREKICATFSVKFLESKFDKASNILLELFNNINFYQLDKIFQLMTETKRELEDDIVSSGLSYAVTKASSGLSYGAHLKEQIFGVSSLNYSKKLLDKINPVIETTVTNGTKEDVSNEASKILIRDLYEIHQLLIDKSRLILNIGHSENTDAKKIEQKLLNMLSGLNASSEPYMGLTVANDDEFDRIKINEKISIPSGVNFVARSIDVNTAGYVPNGAMYLVNNLLSLDYLWKEIRVKGGAYGASGRFDLIRGVLILGTYRDPNLENTYKVYDGIFDYFLNLNLTDDELSGYVIGAIADFDPYMRAGSLNSTLFFRYLQGVTNEMRAKFSDEILNATLEDIKKFSFDKDKIEFINDVALTGENILEGNK